MNIRPEAQLKKVNLEMPKYSQKSLAKSTRFKRPDLNLNMRFPQEENSGMTTQKSTYMKPRPIDVFRRQAISKQATLNTNRSRDRLINNFLREISSRTGEQIPNIMALSGELKIAQMKPLSR